MSAVGCEVEGCDRPHGARGYCRAHYGRKVKVATCSACRRQGRMRPWKFVIRVDDERRWWRLNRYLCDACADLLPCAAWLDEKEGAR